MNNENKIEIKDSSTVGNVTQTNNVIVKANSEIQGVLKDIHEKSNKSIKDKNYTVYYVSGIFLVVVSFICQLFAPQFAWIGFIGIVIIFILSVFK